MRWTLLLIVLLDFHLHAASPSALTPTPMSSSCDGKPPRCAGMGLTLPAMREMRCQVSLSAPSASKWGGQPPGDSR